RSTSNPSGVFAPGLISSNGGKSLSEPMLRTPCSFNWVLKSTPFGAVGGCVPCLVSHWPIESSGVGDTLGEGDLLAPGVVFAQAEANKAKTVKSTGPIRAARFMTSPSVDGSNMENLTESSPHQVVGRAIARSFA